MNAEEKIIEEKTRDRKILVVSIISVTGLVGLIILCSWIMYITGYMELMFL